MCFSLHTGSVAKSALTSEFWGHTKAKQSNGKALSYSFLLPFSLLALRIHGMLPWLGNLGLEGPSRLESETFTLDAHFLNRANGRGGQNESHLAVLT